MEFGLELGEVTGVDGSDMNPIGVEVLTSRQIRAVFSEFGDGVFEEPFNKFIGRFMVEVIQSVGVSLRDVPRRVTDIRRRRLGAVDYLTQSPVQVFTGAIGRHQITMPFDCAAVYRQPVIIGEVFNQSRAGIDLGLSGHFGVEVAAKVDTD